MLASDSSLTAWGGRAPASPALLIFDAHPLHPEETDSDKWSREEQ
jgi:hypothetical protein